MNFLTFMFDSVDHFVPVSDEVEHENMKREAAREWSEIDLSISEIPPEQKGLRFRFLRFAKKNTQGWLAKYLLGIVHIFIIKFVGDWMQAKDEPETESEEEQFKKFQMYQAMTKFKV